MATFNEFMYNNLKEVSEFSSNTKLCIYEPTYKLYIVKTVDLSYKEYYEKIMSIHHINLVPILYIHYGDSNIAIVREYISGESLANFLKGNNTFTEKATIKLGKQICQGLLQLHNNGLVHRDINPNNVIITTDGIAKIIDYGIVRSFKNNKNADTQILGTVGYAAPEQFGFSQSNAQTDIYAMGVLLNVMRTGKLPNEERTYGTIGEIVDRCTQIDAQKRYRSCEELIAAFNGKNKNTSVFYRIVKQIPGFRSNNIFVNIFAVCMYVLVALLSVACFIATKKEMMYMMLFCMSYTMSAVIPYVCFHNVLDIWNRIPITRGLNKWLQRGIYFAIGTMFLIMGMLIWIYI